MISAEEGRARVSRLLPSGLADRGGWATDVYAAFVALDLEPSVSNVCAVIAVAEQETGLKVNPVVPGLPRLARAEIDRRREAAGVPSLALEAALMLPSLDGRSYGERLAVVRTERELSDLYEELIGRVPLAGRFLAERNPVRTVGPMQVSVAFAEEEAGRRTYPYPVAGSIRREGFTRRGGLYFGIAYLLGYPVEYDRMIYRFADFNAGRYASRNAAFQKALTRLSGIPLALDGDLVAYGAPADAPGATERAARVLAKRLGLSNTEIYADLARGSEADFSATNLAQGVFSAADRLGPNPAPRAVLPEIRLAGPKISRSLTTAWYADRVDGRYRACLGRGGVRPIAKGSAGA